MRENYLDSLNKNKIDRVPIPPFNQHNTANNRRFVVEEKNLTTTTTTTKKF